MDAITSQTDALTALIGVKYLRAYLKMSDKRRIAIDTLVGIAYDSYASPMARDKAFEKIAEMVNA